MKNLARVRAALELPVFRDAVAELAGLVGDVYVTDDHLRQIALDVLASAGIGTDGVEMKFKWVLSRRCAEYSVRRKLPTPPIGLIPIEAEQVSG